MKRRKVTRHQKVVSLLLGDLPVIPSAQVEKPGTIRKGSWDKHFFIAIILIIFNMWNYSGCNYHSNTDLQIKLSMVSI